MLRTLIIAVFVIAAALLGETQASKAQSAYSYPWCGIRYTQDGSSTSCYYTSWEQYMVTLSGPAVCASRARIIILSRSHMRQESEAASIDDRASWIYSSSGAGSFSSK